MAMTKPLGTQVDFSSGDLSIDTNTLHVDSTNNRVGIGTTSPAMSLHVEGSAAANNLSIRINNTDTSGYSSVQLGGADAGIYRNGSTQTAYGGASSLNLITVNSHPVSFSTANTERMRIDSAGRVTMPYQPAFTAYGGTDATGATSALVWSTTELNRGSHYNTSNGRFTCPVTGVYVFHYRWLSQPGSAIQPRLFKNGTGIEGATSYGNPASGKYYAGSINVAIQCNANDYVTCGTLSGYPLQGPNYNSGFSGFLLG